MPTHSNVVISNRTMIVSGFTIVIILMAMIIFTGISEFKLGHQSLKNLINVTNFKRDLVNTMHISAFKRVSSLQRMLLLTDPFDRDAEAMSIEDQGSVFARARIKLLAMPLNAFEKDLLENQATYARVTVPLVRQVSSLIKDGKPDEAKDILENRLIPAQQKIFTSLDELITIQKETIQNAFHHALESQETAQNQMVLIGISVALISIYIAFLTYHRVRSAEISLQLEKERAQTTLHSIADGIISCDARGLVDYMNPAAAELTEWPVEIARGKNLREVLQIIDNQSKHVISKLHDFLQSNDEDHLLITHSGKQIAVEYEASEIPDSDNRFKGITVIIRNVTEERKIRQDLSYQATHDPLTGVYNRAAFEELLKTYIDTGIKRTGDTTHALCFIDLDHFKEVNDHAGHQSGDQVLIDISGIIHKHIRTTDFLARVGGDEFAIILENCTLPMAEEICESIRREIFETEFNFKNQMFSVGASIGITVMNKKGINFNHLLEQADEACYKAKQTGKNKVVIFGSNNFSNEINET